MALTTGPLLSLGASGTVAGTLTFATWKGRPYVRQTVTPANPQTPAQTAQRAMMAFLATQWTSYVVQQGDDSSWAALAKTMNVSTFNAFTSANLGRWTQVEAPSLQPNPTGSATDDVLGTLTATGGVGQISIDQIITTKHAGWGLIVQVKPNPATFADGKDGTQLIISTTSNASGSHAVGIVTQLAPGTYDVQISTFTTNGNLTAAVTTAAAIVVT